MKKLITKEELIKKYFDEDQARTEATEEEKKQILKLLKNSGCYLEGHYLELLKNNQAVIFKAFETVDKKHKCFYVYSLLEEKRGGKLFDDSTGSWYGGAHICIDLKGGYLC